MANVLKSVNEAIEVLTLPAGGRAYSSLMLGNGSIYMLVAPEARNYSRLVALDSRQLPTPFKDKTFALQWQPTGSKRVWTSKGYVNKKTDWKDYFDWYFSGFGVNPNGLGTSVGAGVIEPIINFFPNAYRGTYADYWGNLQREARFNFIVTDIFGEPLDIPIQATPNNIEKWNKAKKDFLAKGTIEQGDEKSGDVSISDGSLAGNLNAGGDTPENSESSSNSLIWILIIGAVLFMLLNK